MESYDFISFYFFVFNCDMESYDFISIYLFAFNDNMNLFGCILFTFLKLIFDVQIYEICKW